MTPAENLKGWNANFELKGDMTDQIGLTVQQERNLKAVKNLLW